MVARFLSRHPMSETLDPSRCVVVPGMPTQRHAPDMARPSPWSRRDVICAAALCLLALVARCLHLARQPFWLDEVFTYERIHLGTAALIADSFASRHMPNYFLLLQWLAPPGLDVAALRLPSALFGAASVGVAYAIGRQLAGRFAATVGAVLMALAPTQVQYGQEARSYTLLMLLIAVALWGLVYLARHPWQAALDVRRPDAARGAWAAYLAGTIGALDVLGDAAPWLLVSNLALWGIARELRRGAQDRQRRGFLRNWGLSQGLVLLCCAPFYLAVLAASDGHMLQKFNWVPPLSWHGLWVMIGSTYLMRPAAVLHLGLLPTAVLWLAPLVLLGCGLGLYRLRGQSGGRVLWLALAVLPALLLAVSLFKPMLVPRYMLWSALPFFVLAGIGAEALPARTRPVALVVLLLLAAINLLPVYRIETKARWDRAAALLATQVRPGDTVYAADPNASTMLKALQPAQAVPIEARALVTDQVDVAVARWHQGSRVWAVNGRSAMGQRESLDAFRSRLAALGTPVEAIPQGREITVLVYRPPERID